MFDCVVIGGGVIGVNILRRLLLSMPEWKIALLDRSIIGNGASFYSAGLHFPYGRTEKIRHFSAYSEIEYMLMNSQLNLPITPVPFVGIVSKEKKEFEYSNFIRAPIEYKNNINDISHITLRNNETVFGMNGCHYANVNHLTTRLIEDIRHNSSAKVWEGATVTQINYDANVVNICLHEGRNIQTKHVILAPGPWINSNPFKSLTTSFGVRIKKVVAMHIDQVPQLDDSAIFFLDEDAFLLPLHKQGQWLFSYTCQEWDVDPDYPNLAITSKDRIEALEILKKYNPDLVEKCVSGRVFCDAYSINRAPLITRISDMQNIILAGAANGSGYRLAPAIANDAVNLLLQ